MKVVFLPLRQLLPHPAETLESEREALLLCSRLGRETLLRALSHCPLVVYNALNIGELVLPYSLLPTFNLEGNICDGDSDLTLL
jgi:hypothetical protein